MLPNWRWFGNISYLHTRSFGRPYVIPYKILNWTNTDLWWHCSWHSELCSGRPRRISANIETSHYSRHRLLTATAQCQSRPCRHLGTSERKTRFLHQVQRRTALAINISLQFRCYYKATTVWQLVWQQRSERLTGSDGLSQLGSLDCKACERWKDAC